MSVLDSFLLISSPPESFDAVAFLSSFNKKVVADYENNNEVRFSFQITEPDGVVGMFLEYCKEDKPHFHFSLNVSIGFYETDDTVQKCNWNDIIEELSAASKEELRCILSARSSFDSDKWSTLIDLPQPASGLIPGLADDEVLLSGVEVDLRKTNLPLDSIEVSVREERFFVSADYRRALKPRSFSGIGLLEEAENITKTFVLPQAEERHESPS